MNRVVIQNKILNLFQPQLSYFQQKINKSELQAPMQLYTFRTKAVLKQKTNQNKDTLHPFLLLKKVNIVQARRRLTRHFRVS